MATLNDPGDAQGNAPAAASPLERAHHRLIARRLPRFAAGWLATTLAWAVVLVLQRRGVSLPALAALACQVVALRAAHGACRRDPAAPRVPVVVAATCVLLGVATTVLFAGMRGSAELLAFALLTLNLTSALLFAWGWGAALIVVAGTLAGWVAAFPALTFVLPPFALATAIASGALLSLAIAEGSARAFATASLHRAREEERARELEASRDAYRDLAENARDFIFASDMETRFTYANEALARFVGMPVETVLGRSVMEEFLTDHPANPDPLDMLRSVAAGESVPPQVIQVKTADGPRWVESLVSGIHAPDGRVIGFRGIGRDVTERRQAEEALRESEERFRKVFDGAPIGMVVAGLDGRALQVNRALCEMLGYAEQELANVPFETVTHPGDLAANVEHVARMLSGVTRSFAMEKRYLHKQGHVVWGLMSTSLVRDARGEPAYVISQVQDITQRKQAEEALRASEERYRGLIESQEDLIVRFDRDGRFIFVNDASCRKLGKDRGELLGTSFRPLIHADDEATRHDAMRALASAPYRATVETRSPTPEGWRWISWEACAIKDEAGASVEVQAVGRDVTARRAADEALRASLDELRASEERLRLLAQRQVLVREEERKRVSFDLHDDVCQELVGISILVESLRRRVDPLPDFALADLERIARYLNEVVEHLRLLARDLRPMLLRDLGLEGSLRSLAEGMSSEATRVAAEFETAIPRLGEETELAIYRVAQEALANAVRHARAQAIVVTLGVRDGQLRLEVRDDGCGFAPQARARTCALGLASMEERALALGGRFEVSSEPGRGTAVRLACPLAPRAGASAA
jgi:PAS domain S-box-containing protein